MLRIDIAALFALLVVLPLSNTHGDDAVIVDLQSGQRVRSTSIMQDPKDPQRVVLATSTESIQLRRTLAWSRVRRVEASRLALNGMSVPDHVQVVMSDERAAPIRKLTLTTTASDQENADALNAFVRERPRARIRLSGSSAFEDHVPWSSEVLIAEPFVCNGCLIAGCRAPGVIIGVRDVSPMAAVISAAVEPQPREIIVEARAFNRSGLLDWDSLEVLVQGRTAGSAPCSVRGLLKCTLWGRKQALVRAYADAWFEEPREIALMGQWSQFIEPFEADANGTHRIVLPLDPRLPDHDLTWSGYGLLTVELDIPGQGRLAASTEPIALRQLGPIRGRSINEFGTSFLPHESTSHGVRAIGASPQSLSGLRPDRRLFSVQP